MASAQILRKASIFDTQGTSRIIYATNTTTKKRTLNMTAKDYIAGNGNANANGDTIEVFSVCKTTASLQVIAASLNAADATMKVQESNDGTNWVDVSGASITLASGSSNPVLSWTPRCRYARTVYSKGTVSAGTYTSKIFYR